MSDRYVGVWVTADRTVRHELHANGRYSHAGRPQESVSGRYEICRNHVNYWDDRGKVSQGYFPNDRELVIGSVNFLKSD